MNSNNSLHLIYRVLKGSSSAVHPGRIEVRTAEYDSGCSFDPNKGTSGEKYVLFLNEVGDNGDGSLVHRFEIKSKSLQLYKLEGWTD